MFCSNCGKEIADNQRFCSYCGTENVTHMTTTTAVAEKPATFPVAADGNGGFNRNVLINYLGNLRSLEIIKSDLLAQKATIEKRISALGIRTHFEKASLWECVLLRGWMALMSVGLVVVPAIIANLLRMYLFTEGILAFIMDMIKIAPYIVVAYNIVAVFVDYFKAKNKYSEAEAKDERRVNAEQVEKAKLEKKLTALRSELKKTNTLLTKAYAINVIPTKCRNIYGAYFLYDYMTTSAATLSEALFHFDLDEISKRLDRVIQLQKEQIIQNARMQAMNQQIIMQNEELIQHAIAVEENTARAAQYAEVAAVNTETVGIIQSVHAWYDMSRR
ncbi:MAG: zinc ribbon domain-containing protein [Clostridia bacterium]|nr:zinc ribbon domain-containing protein [Clostridia bacterium]